MNLIDLSTIPQEVFAAADTLHNYFTNLGATDWECSHVADRRLVKKLEHDITELNERLIDRQKTLMEQAVKIQNAIRLLTRCRDSAGRMEMGLYEDIQNFLHTQP